MKRTKQRGAAMVEGIVVITMMLVVLGMVLFAYAAWGGKIDQAHQTRSSVLYYASHGCTGEQMPEDDAKLPNGTLPATVPADEPGASPADVTTPQVDDDADDEAYAHATREKPAIERNWNMAYSDAEMTVSASAIVNLQKFPLEAKVKTRSVVGCNERNYHSSDDKEEQGYFNALWDFMVAYGRSRGGIF